MMFVSVQQVTQDIHVMNLNILNAMSILPRQHYTKGVKVKIVKLTFTQSRDLIHVSNMILQLKPQ
jgi:hypothetical protein